MSRTDIQLLILADAPEALAELCGISPLERLLRVMQRLQFERAIVVSATPEAVRGELARRSWSREKVVTEIVTRPPGPVTPAHLAETVASNPGRQFILPNALSCDPRLLGILVDRGGSVALVDSSPPPAIAPLLAAVPLTSRGRLLGPVILTRAAFSAFTAGLPLFEQLHHAIDAGTLETIDAAAQPAYLENMKRSIRPVCFPLPPPGQRARAEHALLNAAQKGMLDLPGQVHAPLENWTISHLCKTTISPNQITMLGLFLGAIATLCFSTGHLVFGTLLALLFCFIDGLDGKLARARVETAERSAWQNGLDYVLETSWWAALAFYLWRSATLATAFYFFWLFFAADLLDRLLRRRALHVADPAPFDRAFHLIGGRRNIYVWMLALGLCLGSAGKTYIFLAGWAVVTLLVDAFRLILRAKTAPRSA